MSAPNTIYYCVVGAVRVASNALAAPVWVGIWAGVKSLWSAGGMWENTKTAFTETFKWSTSTTPGIIIAIIFGIFGLVHAIRLASAGSYDDFGFLGFLADHSWALPNTIVGSVFATLTAGISIDSGSKGSGRLLLTNGVFGKYDTTFGPVTAGTQVKNHEYVHVVQSWLVGPFFYPIFIANYIVNLVPWWLLLKWIFNIYPNAKIDGPGTYFTRGVYPFTFFELIAYAVEGSPP